METAGFDSNSLSSKNYAIGGGIVGFLSGGSITDCYFGAKVKSFVNSSTGVLFTFFKAYEPYVYLYAGGIAGQTENAVISKCFSVGTEIADYRRKSNGGADIWGDPKEGSKNVSKAEGQITGYLISGSHTDCYYMNKSHWAIGNIDNNKAIGVKAVPSFKDAEIVDLYTRHGWEYAISNAHPTLPEITPSPANGPAFIIAFKHKNSRNEPSFSVAEILPQHLSDAMTVYFTTSLDLVPYTDVTDKVTVRYNFSKIGGQPIQFIYDTNGVPSAIYNGTIPVSVEMPYEPVTGISLSKKTLLLRNDNTAALMAEIIPGTASNQKITWSSSNEDVAVVDEYGNVTGVALGTAVITATTDEGGFTAQCVVTVTDGPIPGDPVIIPSDTEDNATIHLTAETIDLDGFTVAAYSVNGGKKWKKGALPADPVKFSKLFDKALELWVSDTWNDKAVKDGKTVIEPKGVPESATIIKFPKINARPKANLEKLKPWFSSEAWTPKTKTGGDATKMYEWAPTVDKKKPSGDWLPLEDGFAVQSGKTKTTTLFRAPAEAVPTAEGIAYTPNGKIFKLTPANFGKAPNYRVKTNNKTGKQTVKLKANDWYQLGSAEPEKATAAKELDVTDQAGTLTIWKGETGKKSRSEKQEIALG